MRSGHFFDEIKLNQSGPLGYSGLFILTIILLQQFLS